MSKESPRQTLEKALSLIGEREKIYGSAEDNFQRIATIAGVMLGRTVSRYEVATILVAVKLGRMNNDPNYVDSYDDAINYLAFMKMFREESGG